MTPISVVSTTAADLKMSDRLADRPRPADWRGMPGPVSRILVVPGEHVRAGQSMLTVSSPDYSQLLGTYLKARDTYRVADKNYQRAQDLFQHNAIAERDLLQAESDRVQAQVDLNAAEQAIRQNAAMIRAK